jgi:hypothetical protein
MPSTGPTPTKRCCGRPWMASSRSLPQNSRSAQGPRTRPDIGRYRRASIAEIPSIPSSRPRGWTRSLRV